MSSESSNDCFSLQRLHKHFVYEKKWRPKFRGGRKYWIHNEWPPEIIDLDNESPADEHLDLANGSLKILESVVEIFQLKRAKANKADSAPTVVCIRSVENSYFTVVTYIYRPYDKNGEFIGRVTRYDGKNLSTLSEGYIRKFDIKNVIELNPHPGNRLVPCYFRKHFYSVHIEAAGALEGRKINQRSFVLSKYVYPNFTNRANFTRWLKAREPST